jgi:NADH dehydrogenase
VILIVGGTGLLGRHVVHRLTDRSEQVRVLTRDPAAARELTLDGVQAVRGDLRDQASVDAAVDGATTVIAAAHGLRGPRGVSPATIDRGGNAHLIDAASAAGADVLLMSIVGASPDHPVGLFRMKYAAEQHLRAAATAWTIVRATAYAELWISILRETAGKDGRPLVFGRGESRNNFVSVLDVSALVDVVVRDGGTRGEVLEIGGPDNLSMNELAQLVQDADRRAGAPRHIPRWMLHLMANTAGLASPQLRRQVQASLAIDATDHSVDTTELRSRFPNLPRTEVRDLLGQASCRAEHE